MATRLVVLRSLFWGRAGVVVALTGQALAGAPVLSRSGGLVAAAAAAATAAGSRSASCPAHAGGGPMSTPRRVDPATRPRGRDRPVLVGVNGVTAVAGSVGTWFYNLRSRSLPGGFPAGSLHAWFAYPASSSVAVTLISVFGVCKVVMVVEGRRVGMRAPWASPLLALPSALAFIFPLFLLVREGHLYPGPASARRACR